MHLIEPWRIQKLRELQTRLYTEKRMSSDEMRDWANWLWANLNTVEENGTLTDQDIDKLTA